MTCREALGKLTSYLDGELDGSNASAVRGHLRVCATCRICAEDHAAIRDSLAGLERAEPTPAVWDGVLARLGEAEIADGRRSRWARLYDRLRPHLAPASIAVGACAAAAMVIQLRNAEPPAPTGGADLVLTPTPERAAEPAVTPDRPPRPPVARDATAELADETARIDARYRRVTADLLAQVRSTLGDGTRARRRFDREVALLEHVVLGAADGKPRDRAWHALIGFLERSALGEQVAEVRR